MSRAAGEGAAPVMRTLRAAIYTRKSSEEGLEQGFNSLHAQRDACDAYIRSQIGEGWTALSAEYDDGGYSGGTVERPALKRLLADIDNGGIDIVVVYKVDRLTRALSDFAKIVDRFDARQVSFVSVTQAFNTTTSMGRLTLNVLLSFAQFEREVTGERIRDKIAASKAKGMWMGGKLPLGYDPHGRTLIANGPEAEQVRHIFRRYLEVQSADTLCLELERDGILSKTWITKDGKRCGGNPIARGALYHLLKNRTYRGEIVHREKVYPGLHEAIVPEELFEQVQAHLETCQQGARSVRTAGKAIGHRKAQWRAPLVGLLRDGHGNPLTPSYANKNGKRYRYYFAPAGRGTTDTGRRVQRISGAAIENLVKDRALRLLGMNDDETAWTSIRAVLLVAEVSDERVVLRFDKIALDRLPTCAVSTDRLLLRIDGDDRLTLDRDTLVLAIDAVVGKQRGSTVVLSPDRGAPLQQQPIDLTLLRALGRAEAWRADLMSGREIGYEAIAQREKLPSTYVRRLTRMAFLAPDLKQAIITGDQPVGLSTERFMRNDLPLNWDDQRALFRGRV